MFGNGGELLNVLVLNAFLMCCSSLGIFSGIGGYGKVVGIGGGGCFLFCRR